MRGGGLVTLLPEDFARYGRQILLAEIGVEGQRRLKHARAFVGGDGLAHRVAVRYAERAGFSGIEKGSVSIEALAPFPIVSFAAAREVVAGARAALEALRAAAIGEVADP